MKRKTDRQVMEEHIIEDRVALAQLPTREDIIKVVGDAVDVKINGKLIALKEHLNSQDSDMRWIKWFVMGISGGIGLIVVSLIANKL